jgi:hypothetical protein
MQGGEKIAREVLMFQRGGGRQFAGKAKQAGVPKGKKPS